MIPEYPEEICFRLSKVENNQIDEIVQKGTFESKSQVIREALKIFLKGHRGLNNEKQNPQ
jgi:Arc/MetJ-type ribon-helix-helix transcriptional regulator